MRYLEHSLVMIDHFPCDVTVCGRFNYYSTNRGWGGLGGSHVHVMYCSLWGNPNKMIISVCTSTYDVPMSD